MKFFVKGIKGLIASIIEDILTPRKDYLLRGFRFFKRILQNIVEIPIIENKPMYGGSNYGCDD